MPTNDDGEFEYALGNKQVISIFFIVIFLLCAFFAMGYIFGRNSGPMDMTKKNGAGDGSAPVRTDAQTSMPGSSSAINPVAASPAPSAAEPISVEPVTPRSIERVIPKPPIQKEPAGVALATGSVVMPIPGQIYVQVVAVAKPQAELLAEVLAKKGFKAVVAAGPDDTKYRVLVGPAKDASDAGRIKGDLEQAGFKQAFPKKF